MLAVAGRASDADVLSKTVQGLSTLATKSIVTLVEEHVEEGAVVAQLLCRCFAQSPVDRPTAVECEAHLVEYYRQLAGKEPPRQQPTRPHADVFKSFPFLVRQARFHMLVTGEWAMAATLLQEQLV